MANHTDNDGYKVIEPDNVETPPPYREGRPQIVTTDTARQGPGGFRVLTVLVLSLIAAVLIGAAGAMFGWW